MADRSRTQVRCVFQDVIYKLARAGEIPAMRVGREWRFARKNLIEWVANGSKADQVAIVLRNGRVARKRK